MLERAEMNKVGDIDALLRRIEELSKENERLKGLLSAHGISYVQKQEKRTEDKSEPIQIKSNEKTAKYILTPQQKISLFRSLFKGREDVFARRWHSMKTGKSGYQPVCMNEWTPLCDKKKYKCTECPNRKFSELTDDDIYRHLAQYTGRLHRNYEGKKEVRVYDYVDLHQPMCETMYKRRLRGYAAVGYKIEDVINDNPQKDSLHIIYNGENFESTFLQDIDSAKSSIIISCPLIRIYHRHEIIDHLVRASARGVNIQVFVHKCGYDEDKLKELGINVVMKDSLSLQCAVIDKSLYWYGDVNILGFHASDSSIIRMDDVEVAGLFLDIIYGE